MQLTLGKEESALSTLKAALEIDPGYVEAWCVLGDVYLDLGEYDDAKDAFMEALRLEPENPEPHRKMAMYLVSRGEMEKLREVCERLGTLDPSMAEQIRTLFFDEQ